MKNQPASPRHDWILLVVLLAVELDKASFSDLIVKDAMGNIRSNKELVMKRCSQAKDPDLCKLLEELMAKAWPTMSS